MNDEARMTKKPLRIRASSLGILSSFVITHYSLVIHHPSAHASNRAPRRGHLARDLSRVRSNPRARAGAKMDVRRRAKFPGFGGKLRRHDRDLSHAEWRAGAGAGGEAERGRPRLSRGVAK